MKDYKYIKKIDKLGKITLPIGIRNKFILEKDDFLQFCIENNTIKINKLDYKCIFCGNIYPLKLYKNKFICENCIKELKKMII